MNTPFFMLKAFLIALLLLGNNVVFGQISGNYTKNELAPGTSLMPGKLVFKLKPAYKQHASRSQVEIAILRKALAAVGANNLQQKFPNAAPPSADKPESVDLSLIYQIEYSAQQPFEKIRSTLLSTGVLEYVEPLYIRDILHQPNDPAADSVSGAQWYLKNIKAYQAWDIEQGDSTIVIGITDTGIRFTHTDLRANLKYNYADPIDGVDNDNDGFTDNYRGWDFADNDNDPTALNQHGVQVTGVSSATTNNSNGIAGVGYNFKYIPLKVFSSTANGGFGGYEAVVYAADKGCKVINLSWGGVGFASKFEQDVVNYAAINHDAVVVAAAGNTPDELDFYPASYNNVISVAATTITDEKGSSHTYSYKVDLSAPGVNIYTVTRSNDNAYTATTGSSYSAPMVSAAAALVRKHFPNLNAAQVAEQLRVTADDIYSIPGNAPYLEMLGKGRLNMYRALADTATKAVRNITNTIDKGLAIYPGDTISVVGEFKNFLKPVNNLQITVTSSSPYVTVMQNTFSAGAMGTLATASNTTSPFTIRIHPNAPVNEEVVVRYSFADGNYTDFQSFKIIINPDYVRLNVNNLDLTVTSQGNLGFNAMNFDQGYGVSYKNSTNLMYEGGLIVGTSATTVSDNIRNAATNPVPNGRFISVQPARLIRNSAIATAEAAGIMQDSFPAASAVGVTVRHKAYAWQSAPYNDFVILEYTITNSTTDTLRNLYAGIFSDWDVLNAGANVASWDSANAMGYVYNPYAPTVYAAIKELTGNPNYYAIDAASGAPGTITFIDGFSDAEKYASVSSGTQHKSAGLNGMGNDVAHVVSSGMPDLAPGASKRIAFAVIGGDSLAAIQASAVAAQQKYNSLRTSPMPLVLNDTICQGSTATITPSGGNAFKFYADSLKTNLLASGANFTTPSLQNTTTYYVTNTDSLYESDPAAVTIVTTKPVSNFTFSPDTVIVNTGGNATFTDGSQRAISWKWYFGDGDSATTQNPSHVYSAASTYTVTLIATDKFGCSDTTTQTLVAKLSVGISEELAQAVKIFPNPSNGLIQLQHLNSKTNQELVIQVYNAIGKKVVQQKVSPQTENTALDLRKLSDGIYFLHISEGDQYFIRKIQIEK